MHKFKNRKFSKQSLILFAVVFAAAGTIFLLFTNASTALPADINNDGTVGVGDLSLLLSSYNKVQSTCVTNSSYTCDLNSDGKINILDLSILLSNYGKSSVSDAAAVRSQPNLPSSLSTNPVGGWKLEYADAFGLPILGSGQSSSSGYDNTWYPNRISTSGCGNQQGFNSNELEVFNCSKVHVESDGLHLDCNYTPSAGNFYSNTENYTCGTITGVGTTAPAGYKFFKWNPAQGQEWAVQITTKWPKNTGEADPGWWASDWTNAKEEIDFFEGFGIGATSPSQGWCPPNGTAPSSNTPHIGAAMPAWLYPVPTQALYANEMVCNHAQPTPFDPAADFHTYTIVFFPNNTVSAFIDGHIQSWDYVPKGGSSYVSGGTIIGPLPGSPNGLLPFLISYGLRGTAGVIDSNFTSGTRTFSIRSVAVYENASANGANTQNADLAPGTTVAP
jgi:hypothetical protein